MVQQVAGTMTSTTTRRNDAPRERAAFQPRVEHLGGAISVSKLRGIEKYM